MRMSTNNSQTGHSPSESSIPNNTQQSNIAQLLSMENVNPATTTIDQSSSIQLNPTDMAVHIQEHHNLTTRQDSQSQQQHQQQANREEQQRQLQQQLQSLRQEQLHIQREQSRIQRAQNRIQREQQLLQLETRRESQHQQREGDQQHFQEWLDSYDRRLAQWQQQENEQRPRRFEVRESRQEERDRLRREEWEHQEYLRSRSPGYTEAMDEELTERELEEYNLQRLSTQERKDIWEQQHLNQFEGNPTPRPDGMPIDDLERYAMHREQQLAKDNLEQRNNIDEMENSDRLEQHNRNQEQLIPKEQWEEIAFLYQQLQQPTSNTS